MSCLRNLTLLALLSLGLIFCAPHFLAYGTSRIEAEAVVLLVGPDEDARQKEAISLLMEGFAQFLLIPATGAILGASSDGAAVHVGRIERRPASGEGYAVGGRRIFENTHLELLRAKAMMDALGLKSANLVSSPYHMRRIQLIASRVFEDGSYRLAYVPTRFEQIDKNPLRMAGNDFRWILSEYVKILWFGIYEPLCA